ncbi:MAG: hypothetical protein QW176_02070 [Candidatus Bathyarchaeia archaeon]
MKNMEMIGGKGLEKRLFSYDPNTGEKLVDRRGYVKYAAAGRRPEKSG